MAHALLENVDSKLGGRADPPRLLAMESTGRRSPHPIEFTSASNRQSRGETMALSKRVRFDIFKRDAFTCQYCGRKTPEVLLESGQNPADGWWHQCCINDYNQRGQEGQDG